jgi:hypothetical protein
MTTKKEKERKRDCLDDFKIETDSKFILNYGGKFLIDTGPNIMASKYGASLSSIIQTARRIQILPI